MGVLQFQSLNLSLLLQIINTIVKRLYFVFLFHQFVSRLSKHKISISSATIEVRESENSFVTPWNINKLLSIGKCVLIHPPLTWKQCDTFTCANGFQTLRWTGHQASSFRVISLRSLRTCFSLRWVPRWGEQSTNLFVVEIYFLWNHNAFCRALGWRQEWLVVRQCFDMILNFSKVIWSSSLQITFSSSSMILLSTILLGS